MPVPANCSAKNDKLQCSAICRRLIETMSQSTEDSPLVQTVVLAATKTLACQRFNESERVPLPRNFDGSTHLARLDGETNNWKFFMGPRPGAGRSDLGAESNDGAQEESEPLLGRVTQPKYLGGFYRWCDEHWIYAGVSLHEPLCCLQHLPKKYEIYVQLLMKTKRRSSIVWNLIAIIILIQVPRSPKIRSEWSSSPSYYPTLQAGRLLI
jgi:hypothetical protein